MRVKARQVGWEGQADLFSEINLNGEKCAKSDMSILKCVEGHNKVFWSARADLRVCGSANSNVRRIAPQAPKYLLKYPKVKMA